MASPPTPHSSHDHSDRDINHDLTSELDRTLSESSRKPSGSRFSRAFSIRHGPIRSSTGSATNATSTDSSASSSKKPKQKGPYGLTTLHRPASDEEPIAHIIFVHGLGGSSERTWSHGSICWPRDLLPAEDPFQQTAIHTFGYDSDFTKSSVLNINDFAKADLLNSMIHNPLLIETKV
jgi:hypothetical protein